MPTDEVELVAWREAPARPVLCKGRVHLWRVDLDGFRPASESASDVLSDDESERARRFRFERDRDRFVIRRALLRSILGSYLDADPRRLEFDYGEMQKPTLAVLSESGDLMFNQSQPDEAVRQFVGEVYIQHNPDVGDGKQAFIDYFERMHSEFPCKTIEFVRAVADGDMVALHTHQNWPGGDEYVTMDFFRFDEDGKIVEHWDSIQEIPETSLHGNPMY